MPGELYMYFSPALTSHSVLEPASLQVRVTSAGKQGKVTRRAPDSSFAVGVQVRLVVLPSRAVLVAFDLKAAAVAGDAVVVTAAPIVFTGAVFEIAVVVYAAVVAVAAVVVEIAVVVYAAVVAGAAAVVEVAVVVYAAVVAGAAVVVEIAVVV